MSNIPRARELLKHALEIDPMMREPTRALVEDALSLMTRERYKPRRAKAALSAPTEREAKEIRQIVKRNPLVSILDLAKRFRTNPGRISEALGGQR